MSRVAVIGEGAAVRAFALAGALVLAAETGEEIDAAWRALPADVAVAVLTTRAFERLRPAIPDPPGWPLIAVMPS